MELLAEFRADYLWVNNKSEMFHTGGLAHDPVRTTRAFSLQTILFLVLVCCCAHLLLVCFVFCKDLSASLKQEVNMALVKTIFPLRKVDALRQCSDECLGELVNRMYTHVFMPD